MEMLALITDTLTELASANIYIPSITQVKKYP